MFSSRRASIRRVLAALIGGLFLSQVLGMSPPLVAQGTSGSPPPGPINRTYDPPTNGRGGLETPPV